MFENIFQKIKFDWWEVTNLGFVGYFRYGLDWIKYLFGYSTYRPDMFAYSEIDMDMDIGKDVDEDQSNFLRKPMVEQKFKKAGLIPYFFDEKIGQFKYLLMISSNAAFGGIKPMVSKGGQDPEDSNGNQESILDCAIREAVEELGLKEANLVSTFYLMSKSYPKYDLFMYAGEITNPEDFDKPGYETEYTKWMTAEDFFASGREDHQEFVEHLERFLLEK